MNTELFERVIGRIEADPGSLDMGYWAVQTECGTTACLAGHTVYAVGYRFRFMRTGETSLCFNEHGETVGIRETAQELLGLNRNEARYLFDACNPSDVEFLRSMGKFIAEGGHTDEELYAHSRRLLLAQMYGDSECKDEFA